MEVENKATNPRSTGSSGLPALTLIVLVSLIAALLYVGYEYIADDTNGSDELTNVALDTTAQQPLAQDEPEMLMAPDEVDTSSQPAPVDLSQAAPPADAPVANAAAEDVAADNRETTEGKSAPDANAVAEKTVAAKAAADKIRIAEKVRAEKAKAEKAVAEKAKAKEAVAVAKPSVKPGGVGSSHVVGAGETFYSVANRYNMRIGTLKELNPNVSESDVKAGVTKLNVKVMAVHTVGAGDVLRVVAQKYGVSKEALMRANRKTKDIATRGERLIIPLPEKK